MTICVARYAGAPGGACTEPYAMVASCHTWSESPTWMSAGVARSITPLVLKNTGRAAATTTPAFAVSAGAIMTHTSYCETQEPDGAKNSWCVVLATLAAKSGGPERTSDVAGPAPSRQAKAPSARARAPWADSFERWGGLTGALASEP